MDLHIILRLIGISFNAIGAMVMHRYKIPTKIFVQEGKVIGEPVLVQASEVEIKRIKVNYKYHSYGSILLISGFILQFIGISLPAFI